MNHSTTSTSTTTKNNGITTTSTRIIGGTTAHWAKSYPWFVRLDKNYNSTNTCGGSLITKDCVLTAAHCVEDIKPTQVRIGQDELRNVSKVIMHPNFQENTQQRQCPISLSFSSRNRPRKLPSDCFRQFQRRVLTSPLLVSGRMRHGRRRKDELNQKNPNAYYGVPRIFKKPDSR
jgi:hypothetical protein